jgi:hypothetical protein
MLSSLNNASRGLPGKPLAPWQEEQLPGFPASLHSRKQEAGSNLPGAPGRKPTQHFTASTCRKCGAITITGTIHGLPHHLEPTTLNDHTEYAALADQVPTYDLWPDRTARRRHLEEISHPDRVPRHAQHTCGTTYGTHPRPTPPATNPGDPNGPPPF